MNRTINQIAPFIGTNKSPGEVVVADRIVYREPNLLVPKKQPVGSLIVDTSHPYYPDELAWTSHEGVLYDHTKKEKVNDLGSGNYFTVEGGKKLFYGAGTDITGDFSTPATANTVPWSIVLGVKTPSTLEDDHRVAGFGRYDPGIAFSRGGGPFSIYITSWVSSTKTLAADTFYVLAVTYRYIGPSSEKFQFYVDGVAAGAGGGSHDRSPGFHLGGSDDGFEEPGYFEYAYVYKRTLSLADIKEITSDPYQFLISA